MDIIITILKCAFGILLFLIFSTILFRIYRLIIRLSGIDLYHPFIKIIDFLKKLIRKIKNHFIKQKPAL